MRPAMQRLGRMTTGCHGRLQRLAAAWLLGALALGTAALPEAQAQSGKPKITFEQRLQAKRLFDQAHLAYSRGDYEEAILKWEQSYELSQEPLIFQSVANAYERLGDIEKAYEYLKKWDEQAPAYKRKELAGRLAKLKARLDERHAQEEQEHRKETERRKHEEETQRKLDRAEQKRREQERLLEENRRREEEKVSAAVLGWTVTGIGAAAVATGLVLDAVAAGKRPDPASACTSQAGEQLCRAALRDDIETSNALAVAGDATWIAGAVLSATGVVLLLVSPGVDEPAGPDAKDGKQKPPALEASLGPALAPGGAGALLTGRF
ncbi:MAG: hypothetical protein HY744_12580 [Deltaproteobacteria bacterium]|nr:hypothetical protein [Deltaproteobacteria bacterium]